MPRRVHRYYVYILTTRKNSVLYTGVTNDLVRRCGEHKEGKVSGFTQRYNVNKLVYYEVFQYINDAIAREKHIKGWLRAKKEALIDLVNPHRNNLFENGVLTDIDEQRTKG